MNHIAASRARRAPAVMLIIIALLLAWSAVNPFDRLTWWLEVVPILIAAPLLIITYQRFSWTTLSYTLLFVLCVVMIVGGHYSYARVPLGFTIEQAFSLSRNPYDKLGHLMQGIVPAMAAREFFLRTQIVRHRIALPFICVAIALAISASYELIEWLSAVALGNAADDFLGTQGDPWDTQSDMACALVAAILALLLLSRWQDRQMDELA